MNVYVWERRTDRYREIKTGRFVARKLIYKMLSLKQLELSETHRASNGLAFYLVYSRRNNV